MADQAAQSTLREVRKRYGADATIQTLDTKNNTYQVLRDGAPVAVVDWVGKSRGYIKELSRGADEVANYSAPREEQHRRMQEEAGRLFGQPSDSLRISRLRDIHAPAHLQDIEATDAAGQVLGTIQYNRSTGAGEITGRGKYSATDLRNKRLDAREGARVGRTPALDHATPTTAEGGVAQPGAVAGAPAVAAPEAPALAGQPDGGAGAPAVPQAGSEAQPAAGGQSLLDAFLTTTAAALVEAQRSGDGATAMMERMYSPETLKKSGVLEEVPGVPNLDRHTQTMTRANPLRTMTIAEEGSLGETKMVQENTKDFETAVQVEQNEWISSMRAQPATRYTNPAISRTYTEVAELYGELMALKHAGGQVRDYIRDKGEGELSYGLLNSITITKSREVDAKIRMKQQEIDLATRVLNAQMQMQERQDKLLREDREFYADEQNRLRGDLLSGLRLEQSAEQFDLTRMDRQQREDFDQKLAEYDRLRRQWEWEQRNPEAELTLKGQRLQLDLARVQSELALYPRKEALEYEELDYRNRKLDYDMSRVGRDSASGSKDDDFIERFSTNPSKANIQAMAYRLSSLPDERLNQVGTQLGLDPIDAAWYKPGFLETSKEELVSDIVQSLIGRSPQEIRQLTGL